METRARRGAGEPSVYNFDFMNENEAAAATANQTHTLSSLLMGTWKAHRQSNMLLSIWCLVQRVFGRFQCFRTRALPKTCSLTWRRAIHYLVKTITLKAHYEWAKLCCCFSSALIIISSINGTCVVLDKHKHYWMEWIKQRNYLCMCAFAYEAMSFACVQCMCEWSQSAVCFA